MIDLLSFMDLANIDVGELKPKPTGLEGDQKEGSTTLWTSEDGLRTVGVWECTPGRFTADRTKSSETCYFLSGCVEVRHSEGRPQRLGPGDMLVLPRGWVGEWLILEQTKKIYMVDQY